MGVETQNHKDQEPDTDASKLTALGRTSAPHAQVHALEKDMATHSSVIAWRIPGTGSLVGCRLWVAQSQTRLKRLSSSSSSSQWGRMYHVSCVLCII